jgi:hypothetical protein
MTYDLNNPRQILFNDVVRIGARLKRELISDIVSDKKLALLQSHFDDIVKILDSDIGGVVK